MCVLQTLAQKQSTDRRRLQQKTDRGPGARGSSRDVACRNHACNLNGPQEDKKILAAAPARAASRTHVFCTHTSHVYSCMHRADCRRSCMSASYLHCGCTSPPRDLNRAPVRSDPLLFNLMIQQAHRPKHRPKPYNHPFHSSLFSHPHTLPACCQGHAASALPMAGKVCCSTQGAAG
jgi:hypothetical protein